MKTCNPRAFSGVKIQAFSRHVRRGQNEKNEAHVRVHTPVPRLAVVLTEC